MMNYTDLYEEFKQEIPAREVFYQASEISMISNFVNYFKSKEGNDCSGDLYNDFVTLLGGKRFGEGLFNSFSIENVEKWTEIIDQAYSEFKGLYKAFGYDWLGRCFGIDLRKNTYGNILMFEIGTNDVLEIPCSFEKFLNEEIPLYADACLAKSF